MFTSAGSIFRIPLIFFAVIFFITAKSGGEGKISGYKAVFRPYYNKNGNIAVAIREFERNNKKQLLVINPFTFDTSIDDAASLNLANSASIKDSPFIKALFKYTAPPINLQNHGITKGETSTDGVFLTIDLCPSSKELDKDIFLAGFNSTTMPAPISAAISGAWLNGHREEFGWILKQVEAKKLDVTWINHSFSHPYDKNIPIKKNFLLKAGVDFEKEVMATEILLLENGVIPSPFFRFPGLISDENLMKKLRSLSLVPIGASAWLGKGETAVNRSIILIHGNGNEKNTPLIIKTIENIRSGKIILLPLKEAFKDKEEL